MNIPVDNHARMNRPDFVIEFRAEVGGDWQLCDSRFSGHLSSAPAHYEEAVMDDAAAAEKVIAALRAQFVHAIRVRDAAEVRRELGRDYPDDPDD